MTTITMTMKNVVTSARRAVAALALAGLAASAEAADGSIYSIDLVSDSAYGGMVPTESSPLTIGQKAVIRVRMANSNYNDPTRTSNPKPWRVMPTAPYTGLDDTIKLLYPMQIGLMFGGQPVYADYIATAAPATPAATYTDFYFQYTVKSGDLAMPAQLMTADGKAAGSSTSADYMLGNSTFWEIVNDDGDEAVFHYTTSEVSMDPVPGEPQSKSVSGVGMGLYVKTVDFDNSYIEPAATATETGTWRRIHNGLTTTSSTLPSVVVNGTPETALTMYVWVDDESIAAPLTSDGAEEVTDTYQVTEGGSTVTKTVTRHVLPISFAANADPTKTFRLKGVSIGDTVVRMSSSKNLVCDDLGFLVENWVERPIEVITPPEPYAAIEILDRSMASSIAQVACPTNYKDYVAVMKLTLNGQAPTAAVTMTITPSEAVCPEDEEDRRIGISESPDAAELPWLDRKLSVTFSAGETEKYLYIYALDQTEDLAGKVQFTPTLSGAGAGDYTGEAKSGNLSISPVKPVILSPTSDEQLSDAIAGQTYPLDLVIAGSYRAIRRTDWTVRLKSAAFGDPNWHIYSDGLSIDAESGEATVDVLFTVEKDDAEVQIVLVDPQDENLKTRTSATVKAKIDVTAPKKAWATFDRGAAQYAESRTETAKVYFNISQPSDSAKALYAFLRPLNDDANNKVKSAAFTTATTSQGVYIGPGETDSGTGYAEISLLDGNCSALFEVVICTESTYSAAKEASYVSGQCTLNVTNVVPTIRSVSMGGSSVKVSGGTMAKQIALGIPKKFTVDIDDPGLLDLEAAGTDSFLVQWKFSGGEWQDRPGNPSTTSIENAFATPGVHEVVVRCQDKDMRANSLWTEEFSFYVNVLESPKVEIVSAYGLSTFDETMTGDDKSRFNVSLNVPPDFTSSSDRLVVDLTVSLLGDASAYDDGDCVLSKSQVSFASGQTSAQTFYLKTLDGTQESASSGFRITASVSGTSATDAEGKTWDAGEVEFTVVNAAPSIKQPVATTDADGKPISQSTTIGETQSQTWSISDVAADVEGMTVTWVTSEGQRMEYVQGSGTDTDSRKYVTDARSGTHTFYFSGSGEKTVTMTVTDKDGGQNSVTLYYTIAASKTMEILPHGPSSGNGTSLSAKYHDKAAGLGKGKVWTANAATKIANWVFSYGCGLDSEFRVFGKGYRVGDVDDTVGPTGNAIAAGGTGYTYPDAEFDSFFYAWLQLAKADGSSTLSDSLISVSPEHPEDAYTGTMVSLPTEKDDDGNYAKTILEAIFSREYLASDNMGDINLDGIPDAYVKKYGMGVFDDDGNLSGNDLQKLASYNDDNDVLPDGRLFTAKLEIRGFGEGLNDAPTLAGLNGFSPDRRYTDPDVDAKSTLTKLEYLAWLDYAAANGLTADSATDWTQWSPERPTDPTLDDTDEDGFSDAFEYYYWYRAHVGYFQTSVAGGVTVSNHVYLTGRRFEPGNPEGSVITSETIAALMDPITASGDESDAETRDTDNDGLPDLLEFELGTNPFDFDTDGDGLPDGWEVLISGTDPTLRFTEKDTIADPDRNYDGDHMAYTAVYTVEKEEGEEDSDADVCEEVAALQLDGLSTNNVVFLTSFAVADSSLGAAGVQWYVVPDASKVTIDTTTVSAALTTFEVYDGTGLWTDDDSWTAVAVDGAPALVDAGAIGGVAVQRLSVAVEASKAFLAEKDDAGALVRGLPKRLSKGSFVREVGTASEYVQRSLAADVSCLTNGCNRAWLYGVGTDENKFKFGELAIGPTQAVSKASVVLAAPTTTRKVAYLHSYVYQQFGFDPRTAWNSDTPLGARWGSVEAANDEGATSGNDTDALALGSGSRAGTAQRTRPYTAYDEFLLMSYWLKSDCIDESDLVADPKTRPWATLFSLYTTNPHGPDETLWASNKVDATTWDTNGADTDKDGVPDGWELYVMSGNLVDGSFKIFGPEASMSPFTAEAANASRTDSDGDGLTEWREFAATDSCNAYTNYSDTASVRPPADVAWLNKFFPTDPWNEDTDGDGIADGAERDAFAYGEPVDNGSTSICGGGLNPCSVDTDGDGLPDGWEVQFAGTFIESDAASTTGTNVVAGVNCITNGMDGTFNDATLDYDMDGLENWQEYMVGAMRCWRYDDPISSWKAFPKSWYFDDNDMFSPNLSALGCNTIDEFWYKTLVDRTSGIYNPNLVYGMTPCAMYFTRVKNPWDRAYGGYYMFKDKVDGVDIAELWGKYLGYEIGAPAEYISCDPTNPDTDNDGMDDYWELFHGLNPLLGRDAGIRKSGGALDVVYEAWGGDGKTGNPAQNASLNSWLGMLTPWDVRKHVWLNGLADADPDGDDIRNQEEAIMARVGKVSFMHTDPTPLWMTDSTYAGSLTYRCWAMPQRDEAILDGNTTFTWKGKEYNILDFPGFAMGEDESGNPAVVAGEFTHDLWGADCDWMFSFEEHEGYDTDVDGYSDHAEKEGKFSKSGSDPLDPSSPVRRQAMYFQGPSNPSLVQMMPHSTVVHPTGQYFPNEMAFAQYTAECWACPESLDDSTVLERVVSTEWSHVADETTFRINFRLAIKDGKWYTCFDSNGTLSDKRVEVFSTAAAESGRWTHLAATYDGKTLRLYVDGVQVGSADSGLTPAYSASHVDTYIGYYVKDSGYKSAVFNVGAHTWYSMLTGYGISTVDSCFKGYVDEVRVWDGARSAADIRADKDVRYTSAMALANRETVYDEWSRNIRRYVKDANGNDYDATPELRYHYSFDALPAGSSAATVAKVPHGFGPTGDKAPSSRPSGYVVTWWNAIVNGDASLGFNAYGSVYDQCYWVPWIHNTVAALPRMDGLTLDSFYWTADFCGTESGVFSFPRSAEPTVRWTQFYKGREADTATTTRSRYDHFAGLSGGALQNLYDFETRHRDLNGNAMLPLGGAFVKHVPASLGFWDGQGASTISPISGQDSDNDGLPDWWELYAEENYRRADMDPSEFIGWNTIVDYHGMLITAGEAYLRDIAKGAYVDDAGNAHISSDEYVQRADTAGVGIPDWWMDLYGIKGEGALDDHDGDGLSNYHEYLLSEVFKFQGVAFDPTVACSVDPNTPDYFFRVGSLYVGEIFTDHDLVDDDWEDVYGVPYASRLVYDAFADVDEDGWSNRSENRYARQCQAIVANNSEHYSAVDGLVNDYPVPTLGLKVRYNGSRREAVNRARFVVMVFSEERGAGARTITDPDATYIVNSSELVSSEDDSTSTTEGSGNVYTKTLGRWSNRHVLGTLTPGSVNQGSLQFQFCGDPSALTYEWYYTWEVEWPIHSGSLVDLISARKKYGSDQVVVLSKESAYQELIGYTSSIEDETQILTWTAPGGSTLGTINLITGAYDINLGALKGQYVESTNDAGRASLEGQVYRIAYSANPSTGLPRSLYLGEASAGHVREGKNTVVVYADFDSSVDEETLQQKPWSAYAAGAPIGVVKGVDVSWRSGSAELELLETNPMFARYDIVNGVTDREARWPTNSASVVSTGTGLVSSDANTRVRIVRYAIDNLSLGVMSGKDFAVVFDKTLRSMDAGSIWLTEADILGSAGCEFDLDWDAPALYSGSSRLSDYYEEIHGGTWQFTNIYYAVYIGNDAIPSAKFGSGCMDKLIVRSFDLNRQRPTLLASSASVGETGAAYDTVVYDAAPTFRWTMNGYDTYTAFRVNVLKDGTSIYDSGYQRMPPRNDKAEYSWKPPVFAGDKLPSGAVVENKSIYTWKLSVYNAKFRTDDFVTSEPYYLNVQTNSPFYGVQDVAVRYFGPKASYSGKTIRVQAFASPDFTGDPVAAGYVAAPDDADSGVAVTGKVVKANARLIGIPLGTYYLRAYIDSNNNGVWDPWETMGYFCRRDGTSANGLDVLSVRYSNVSGKGEIFQIFMEDADTDQDGLPDSWEYATYGSLNAKGVELLTATPAGEALVNTALTGALELQAGTAEAAAGIVGVASDVVRSAGVVALALGIEPSSSGSFTDAIIASLSPELEEDGVSVSSIGFDDAGNIVISISAEASAPVAASTLLAASTTSTTTVSYKVLHVETLAAEWATVKEGTMTISAGENEQTITLENSAAASAASGFYKVVLEK